MDYLRKLIFLPRRQKADSLSLSFLNTVPLDILAYIVDNYLLPESATAFSLTCKRLKYLFGTQCIPEINLSTKNTLALLNLLALDLSNHIVCSPCGRLHKMENLLRYNSATYSAGSRSRYQSLRLPACVSQDRKNNVYAVTHLFGTTAFQMVMKRYHEQPAGYAQLLELMSSQEPTTRTTGDYVRQSREDCRIVQGCLMHRLQNVYISWKCPTSTVTDIKRNAPSDMICPHLNLRTGILNNMSGVQRCKKCCTEYCIGLKCYEGYGIALFLSRWKNLGPGPESEVWTQHLLPGLAGLARLFSNTVDAQTSVGPQSHTNYQHRDEAIWSSFRDGKDDDFESFLTPKNRAVLFRVQKQYWRTTD